MKDMVILVDEQNKEIGVMEKLEAHVQGNLHRAISVFIFNGDGEMLLQKRADSKYHSGGLWTNACCSHPKPGEKTLAAAKRRLIEEMNMKAELKFLYSFGYLTNFKNGLIEHELDHMYFGITNNKPELNPEEASDWKYMNLDDIGADLKANPSHYSEWFKLSFEQILISVSQHLMNRIKKTA